MRKSIICYIILPMILLTESDIFNVFIVHWFFFFKYLFIFTTKLIANNRKNCCFVKNVWYIRIFKFSILLTIHATDLFHPHLFRIYSKNRFLLWSNWKCFWIVLSLLNYMRVFYKNSLWYFYCPLYFPLLEYVQLQYH